MYLLTIKAELPNPIKNQSKLLFIRIKNNIYSTNSTKMTTKHYYGDSIVKPFLKKRNGEKTYSKNDSEENKIRTFIKFQSLYNIGDTGSIFHFGGTNHFTRKILSFSPNISR